MTIFKAYDIRGTYPDQIDESIARRIGSALAKFLGAKRLVAGRDMRTMAPAILDAVIAGILDQGCDVLDIGLASTPATYFAIGKYPCDGGICVTASHNPSEYIGFKMCHAEARPLSATYGIPEIKQMVEAGELPATAKRGISEPHDVRDDFAARMLGFVERIDPQTLVIDYANGMGAHEGPGIFAQIPGLTTVPLYQELDGSFPNHEANPLHEPNLDDLRAKVREHGAPMGIAFDGDADRCAFVDEDGRTVHADLITVILARGMLRRHPGKGIIYDLRSSKVVAEEILKLGGKPVMDRVGHSFMKETMRREDCIGGGELSGHFYFAENYYTDCGILACIQVLNELTRDGRSLKVCADELRRYFPSGEINFRVEDKAAAMAEIERVFADGQIEHIDGVTVSYPNWWVNVRPSNTEPYLRMCLEADTADLLAEKKQELTEIIGRYV